MSFKELYQRQREKEQAHQENMNSYVNKHHTFSHQIVTEQKGDNKFAMMQ